MGTISSLKEIKKGIVLIYNNEPCQVVEAKFLRMQQRKPVMQTKLKSLASGKAYEYSFKQGEDVETADLERKSANYLYHDGNNYVFMDNTTYDQIFASEETLGDAAHFLKENLSIDLLYWNNEIVSVKLPPKVDLLVTEAEPGVRGDTAQGSVTKMVTLESGHKIHVPIFVNQGDTIKVNTDTNEYDSRV